MVFTCSCILNICLWKRSPKLRNQEVQVVEQKKDSGIFISIQIPPIDMIVYEKEVLKWKNMSTNYHITLNS